MPFWKKNESKENPSEPQADHRHGVGSVKHLIAVASGKGGVGKSTVAVNLAVALQKLGYEVGLLDADIYGPSQAGMLGASQSEAKSDENGQLVPLRKHGVSFVSMALMLDKDTPVIWRAPMAMKMIQQFMMNVNWGPLDYLILDLPPGTGDVQLTLAQSVKLSGALIVSTPQEVAVGVALRGMKMFQQVKVPILGVVENMSGFVCEHCGKETAVFRSGGAKEIGASAEAPLLASIPLDPQIMMAGDEGVPIVAQDSDSALSKVYFSLATGMESRLADVNEEKQKEEPKVLTVNDRGHLVVEWDTEGRIELKPYELRVSCACAYCVDEMTGAKILDTKRVPLDIRIEELDRVGRYAVSIKFSDGHSTGIFAFSRLIHLAREIQRREDQTEAFDV